VSIVVPAHNEEENLERVVSGLISELADAKFEKEVVLVDDCSTDGTGVVAERLAKMNDETRLVRRTGTPGFGKALRKGFEAASGDYVVPFMADGSDSPQDLVRLVSIANGQGYDIVAGTRWSSGSRVVDYPPLKMVFSRAFSVVCRLLTGIRLHDFSNAFRAYNRRALLALRLNSDSFEISAEILIKAYFTGFSIAEVPVDWRGRIRGSSKLKLAKIGPRFVRLLMEQLFSRPANMRAI